MTWPAVTWLTGTSPTAIPNNEPYLIPVFMEVWSNMSKRALEKKRRLAKYALSRSILLDSNLRDKITIMFLSCVVKEFPGKQKESKRMKERQLHCRRQLDQVWVR